MKPTRKAYIFDSGRIVAIEGNIHVDISGETLKDVIELTDVDDDTFQDIFHKPHAYEPKSIRVGKRDVLRLQRKVATIEKAKGVEPNAES